MVIAMRPCCAQENYSEATRYSEIGVFHRPGETVNVVRKKRTYVKRSAIETPVEEELSAAELEPEVEETPQMP